jgi:hypothetical protein
MDTMLRPARREDIAAMHRVRMSVQENRLVSMSLSEADYVVAIEQTGRGRVTKAAASVVNCTTRW